MIMGKLYHYCTNNQKTADPEWELMSSALASLVATIECQIEPVNLLDSTQDSLSLLSSAWG